MNGCVTRRYLLWEVFQPRFQRRLKKTLERDIDYEEVVEMDAEMRNSDVAVSRSTTSAIQNY